jgi:MFS family permease
MILAPQESIDEVELRLGVRHLIWDGAWSNTMVALNSGVVLAAFALYLGAPNSVIGLLAALPFLTQPLQLLAVVLIERLRARKLITVASLLPGRFSILAMAFLPFLADRALALAVMVSVEAAHCVVNTIGTCSWNAWIRDLVPEERMGRFFARRTLAATAVTLVASLAAGVALDWAGRPAGPGQGMAFMGLYLFAFAAGCASIWHIAHAPEPRMARAEHRVDFIRLMITPLRDVNFRQLILFLSSWSFAVNLATPFFTVFLVRQLGFGLTFVVGLSVVSQIANLASLRIWGHLGDHFSHKSVLLVTAPAFIACIAAMIFAGRFEDVYLASAYLIALHVVMGLASAGVNLASSSIALKLAPRGAATAYVATNATITSLAAGVAPILGGVFADVFAHRELSLDLRWAGPEGVTVVSPLLISQWGFHFALAALIGLYAIHRLSLVRETGEIERREMVQQVLLEVRRSVRNLSTVSGLKAVTEFPAGFLLEIGRRRRRPKKAPV